MPPDTLATLTAGLSANSRLGMKIAGLKVPPDTLFLARVVDDLNLLLWAFSKNANNSNKPEAIAETLIEREKDIAAFKTGADLLRKRAEILKKINNS